MFSKGKKVEGSELRSMRTLCTHKLIDSDVTKQQVVDNIRDYLKKRGYRGDLTVVSRRHVVAGQPAPIEVRYSKELEYPSEADLIGLVSSAYPGYAIDWETAEVNTEEGIVHLNIAPAVEVIPINSLKEVPPEFVPVGTGVYKRQASADSSINEIWELRRGDSGLALVRRQDDMDVVATDDNQYKAGQVVDTPYGPGKILRFDESGNAFVQVGNKKQLVAADDLRPYNINKEKQKLIQYYSEIYGPEFAKALVEQYGDNT